VIEKSYMDSEESASLKEENSKVYFPSTYNFLMAHKSFRPGKIHTFLGMPSAGKSTLRNSIITDLSLKSPDKKFFIWLSEESEKDFKTSIAYDSLISKNQNIYLYSEFKNLDRFKSQREANECFKDIFAQSLCDVFIFDNITTSMIYGEQPARQTEFAVVLKQMAEEYNIPFILFAHTGSQINEAGKQLIEMNNIRGSRAIVNLSEFYYILQTFKIGEHRTSTIRITKNRNQIVTNSMFALDYSDISRSYSRDGVVKFKKFIELWKEANKI